MQPTNQTEEFVSTDDIKPYAIVSPIIHQFIVNASMAKVDITAYDHTILNTHGDLPLAILRNLAMGDLKGFCLVPSSGFQREAVSFYYCAAECHR